MAQIVAQIVALGLGHPAAAEVLGHWVRTQTGTWLRVKNAAGEVLQGQALNLKDWTDWEGLLQASPSSNPSVSLPVSDLAVPLPPVEILSLGLGLSYPSHQQEVGNESPVVFLKKAAPTSVAQTIEPRPYLDYEAEVSLLMHRQQPHVFGYLLHNDLTDRALQVSHYDSSNPGPGFSLSKSFPGANAHGPVLTLAGPALWQRLEVQLHRQGELVQTVHPRQNVYNPTSLHAHIFSESQLSDGFDWVLIGTGTPAGTEFYAPTFWQRLGFFLRAGFRPSVAQQLWLDRFHFLQAGETLRFESDVLGQAKTQVGSVELGTASVELGTASMD